MEQGFSFGYLLRRWRRARDMTQNDLAKQVNYALITIKKIEMDERRPSVQLAERLADCLGVPEAERLIFIEAARARASVDRLSTPAQPLGKDHSTASLPAHTILPIPLTPLLGRTEQVALVLQQIERSDIRILTLLGPGGVGKTRLALQVAMTLSDTFVDGVHFVPLTSIQEPGLIVAAIAHAFGVKDSGEESLLNRLKQHLYRQQALLIIDNFEHLLEATPVIVEILEAAPRLKVLLTSRAALRIVGEHEFVVPPLDVPDLNRLPTIDDLQNYAAIELFLQRARAVRPSFTLTLENAAAVAEICVRLDGLPLAIELAAARIKLLSPQALLARLSHRLANLTDISRDLPNHQRTLRRTIEWSYKLLDSNEQAIFRYLAVFVGGFDIAGAESVCNCVSDLPLDMFDMVAALIDQSMLQHRQIGDEVRFVSLETIREYALEQLSASGDLNLLQRAHAQYHTNLAEQAEQALTGAEQTHWLNRLDQEHDNIRAALHWATHNQEVVLGLRLAASLWRFWYMRGYLREGYAWLQSLLAQSYALPQQEWAVRASAFHGAGVLAYVLGDYLQGTALFESALAIRRALDDRRGIAATLSNLGMIAHYRGDYERAKLMYEEALALNRELGDMRGTAISLNNLGISAKEQGAYAQATALISEGLVLFRALQDTRSVADLLNTLGQMASAVGDYSRSMQLCAESLQIFRSLADKPGITEALLNLGITACRQHDTDQAIELFEEALPLTRELADKWSTGLALNGIGMVWRRRQNYRQALIAHRESLALYTEVDDKVGIAACLEQIASALHGQTAMVQAAQLLGRAAAIRETIGSHIPPAEQPAYDELVEGLRAHLGDDGLTSSWAYGRTISLEEAIAIAMLNQ
jgi:predicted ATPase/DNA-binding XRE family transcriptional regulator/Tfp pilus assembly protein PilF